MAEIKDQQIKRKTIISTLSLFLQSGYSAVLGFIANLVLTILLTPKIFGIYFTVLSINSLLNYFSDIGLAASLVQKKEISNDDIKTVFTTQQILIITLVIIGFISTPVIQRFYNLPIEGAYLYWALLLSFFISSLKTIPSILLERKIQFQKIVIVQIVENTVFYLTVIILAILKFNLMSFTYATILRAFIGLVVIYSISFWQPQIGLSLQSLKQLLAFGLPFQASSFLALFKDDLINLYLGKILGFEVLGFIGWAKKWAEAAIRIIMDNITRVLFPVISRLQHDKEKVGSIIEKIIDYQTTLLAPAILGLALIMSKLIYLIPKYNKWSPALPLLYIFCISAFFSSYSGPFINLFNAFGKVKISFSFMVFWTIATWVLTPIFIKFYGIYGFPFAHVILSLAFILVVYQAKKLIRFNFIHSIYRPLISALIMAGIVFFLLTFLGGSFLGLIITIIIGFVIYFTCQLLLFKINLIDEIKLLFFNKK